MTILETRPQINPQRAIDQMIEAYGLQLEQFPQGTVYDCGVVVLRETEGFSAHAEDLPGAVSQGESVEEALDRITEACQGVLREYIALGAIPWSRVEVSGDVECRRRILVHV
jgi:predicted RNase H-like HicB family nuclease